jgi:hypothetical protein
LSWTHHDAVASLEPSAQVERVEAELDSFIEKHAREVKDAERVEEIWAESERRDREKKREKNRDAWVVHERLMQRLHLDLADEHRAKATRLLEESGGGTG